MDFADDFVILSHTQQQNSAKYKHSGGTPNISWAEIRRGKSKILNVNSTSTASVTPGEEAIQEVEHLTYVGSVVDKQKETLKPRST